ncbi:MAG: hypothetical protein CL557_12930 [Alphaproteobacteria bacterium]|nr:hypothetical protein [Alphaproteobacteria bacterium]|tara:strand:+ start:3228 stop:4826 length:1599 start_codon:yes stop_codon:yes gene_type:complete
MASDNGVTFQPIFKGQKTNNPEEIAELAIAGAEYDSDYLLSKGGSWSDPFTGQQIGQSLDWSGVAEMKTQVPGTNIWVRAAGAPSDLFDEGGQRIGDPMVADDIKTPAEGMSKEEILDIAGRVAIVNTFQQDRVALIEQYGDYFLEEVGTDIVGKSVSKLDELRYNTRGYDLLTSGVPSSYRDEDYMSVDDAAMATSAGSSMSLEMMKSNLEVYGTLSGPLPLSESMSGTPGSGTPGSGTPGSVTLNTNESGATAIEEDSATSIVRDILTTYGLEDLLKDESLNLIDTWVVSQDAAAVWGKIRQSETYKGRFPGMEALSKAGRAISESTYIELERGYTQVMKQAGIDSEFYDDYSDFGSLIGGDVSVEELRSRVALASEASLATTPEVKNALKEWYGISDEDITAYYLDPERATNIFEMREQLGSARIGGIAAETGFGSVTQQTAEGLRAAGVSETEARRGFQAIGQSTLAEETAGDMGDITRKELVGAQFGTEQDAARKVEERRQRRLAQFAQQGGPALTQGGYIGLGEAQ